MINNNFTNKDMNNESLTVSKKMKAETSLDPNPEVSEKIACTSRKIIEQSGTGTSEINGPFVQSTIINEDTVNLSQIPEDVQKEIFNRADITTLGRFGQTTKKHKNWSDQIIIERMNDSKLSLKRMGFTSAQKAVDFFVNSQKNDMVEYLDFTGLPINNDQFKELSKKCPNVKHLNINRSSLKGDILSNLQNFTKLRTLDISQCQQLETDALKHLQHTSQLTVLNISKCTQFEKNALKHLKHVKNLESLNITSCIQLEADALKHLQHTSHLIALDISCCTQFEIDALKNLQHTSHLTELNITACSQLEADALKHLEHVKNLKSLDIACCIQLEVDALKHLQYTSHLKKLNISRCNQFEKDALKNLKHTSHLTALYTRECGQLDKNAIPINLMHLIS